jgi:DNA-binding transcriptional LysR family regulator
MSQILSRLRMVSGDPILVRGGTGMLPTARGIELAQAAQHSIDIVEAGFGSGGSSSRDWRRGSSPLWLLTMSKRCFFQP